ncbi:MAG: exodeoxyribonuclease III [Candidatus Margulisiibacteriota bacterium]
MTNIISWNVNGLRAAQNKGFLKWLTKVQPDILCLQETKVQPDQLGTELLSPEGYKSYWQSAKRKGYSGVAVYTKKAPLSITNLGILEFDDEGRVQVLDFDGFTLINAYFPNSQAERARLPYKLRFNEAIVELCNKQVKAGKNVIVCGDFNVAHEPIDLTNPKPNENNPGYYIEERESMDRFLAGGYTDTFRHFNKESGNYTWWSYRFHARDKNIGWRIDFFIVNNGFLPKVKESTILADVYGSDHCPVRLVLDT